MKKIAVVICTFNEVSMPDYLLSTIEGWKSQKSDHAVDIILMDNWSSDVFKNELRSVCKENNFQSAHIPNRYPSFVCRNIGWDILNKQSGSHYDYYAFCSDDTLLSHATDLDTIIDTFRADTGIVSGSVAKDNCPSMPWSGQWKQSLKLGRKGKGQNVRVPLGEFVHNHFMVVSNEYFERYNYKDVDILWSYGTEALLTYLCQAADMYWDVCFRTVLTNNKWATSKVASSRMRNNPIQDFMYKLFVEGSFDEIFGNGAKVGLGWQRLAGYYSYVPSGGVNKNVLHNYICEHLFLKNEVYDRVNSTLEYLAT